MRRVASMPSTPGIRMSITTTSGCTSCTSRSASAPEPACPATSMSGASVITITSPARISGWSSANRTLMGTTEP